MIVIEPTNVSETICVIEKELEKLRELVVTRKKDDLLESEGSGLNHKVDYSPAFKFIAVRQRSDKTVMSEPKRHSPKSALPDPRLIKRIMEMRALRASFFGADLFADPAWNMILDLAIARVEYRRISVSSLCIASDVPNTTALRWIGMLLDAQIFERFDDPQDKRRSFIALSDKGVAKVSSYFAACDSDCPYLI